jgi:hypothetical protein
MMTAPRSMTTMIIVMMVTMAKAGTTRTLAKGLT